jgi:hypothetical protein
MIDHRCVNEPGCAWPPERTHGGEPEPTVDWLKSTRLRHPPSEICNDGVDGAARHPALIIRMAKENPGEITLCPVGPVTNVALALVKAPEPAKLLRQDCHHGIDDISSRHSRARSSDGRCEFRQ